MTNFSKLSPSPMEDELQYEDIYNKTWISSGSSDGPDPYFYGLIFISIFSTFICIVGLVGNGMVIYLLGFRIKKSPFTTYILNLAVADFGVLLFLGLKFISSLTNSESFFFLYLIGRGAASFMHNISQLLLAAISIDRCVAVLFPIWHRCHRPSHLSTAVCALVWVLYGLHAGSLTILLSLYYIAGDVFFYQFISAAVLSLPLVTVSTTVLLVKVFCKPQQPRRGRLLTIILLTLLFFLIFAFPLNAIFTLNYVTYAQHYYLMEYGYLCACLNSCVNPVIYFMVGRKKRGQRRQSLKVVLQRAFQEEEEHRGE